jgi:ATP-dependent DNA helicase RecG
MTSHKLSADSKTRMETMGSTGDGFQIAEVDLKLRGPGKSGYAAKWCSELANCRPVKDRDIFSLSETSCFKKILEVDTAMQRPEHAAMRAIYIELTKKRIFGITSVNFLGTSLNL